MADKNPTLDQWRRLNATEQYFTLLESWLRRGNPEVLGEHSHPLYSALKQ